MDKDTCDRLLNDLEEAKSSFDIIIEEIKLKIHENIPK